MDIVMFPNAGHCRRHACPQVPRGGDCIKFELAGGRLYHFIHKIYSEIARLCTTYSFEPIDLGQAMLPQCLRHPIGTDIHVLDDL